MIQAIGIGITTGFIWTFLVYWINDDMLYYTDLISDKQACSINYEQKFRCEVQS